MKRVLITPRSYGKYNKQEMIDLLHENGIEAIFNPYDRIMNEVEMIQVVKGMDGIIVGVDPITKAVMEADSNLKVVSKYGVGVDNIDCDYAKEHNIMVTRTTNANSNAVADYAMALLMAVARRVVEIDESSHNHDWSKKEALDVYGQKIGIIGLGAIGRGVVKRAKGFDMEVYGYDIVKDEAYIQQENIHFSDIDTIIKECDFISLHLPLTPKTHHILNKENLQNAKENLIIINTARGGLIDENDLYDLLKEDRIYGVGVDVFENEPAEESKLLTLKNVVVGTHTAASSKGAIVQMTYLATNNIIKYLKDDKA